MNIGQRTKFIIMCTTAIIALGALAACSIGFGGGWGAKINPLCVIGAGRCAITITYKWDPPASVLADANVAGLSETINTTNMPLVSTGGSVQLTISNTSTGQVVASSEYPYTISDGVATFADPAEVNAWLQSYSSYPGDVSISAQFSPETQAPPPNVTGTVTATLAYNGSEIDSLEARIIDPNPKCGPLTPKCQPQ